MNTGNPYCAAGTFVGTSYVERSADQQLRLAIQQNHRYPYIITPHKSGTSSLLVRTATALDPQQFRTAVVALSPIPHQDYEVFLRSVLKKIAREVRIGESDINSDYPEETFVTWLGGFTQQLVIFLDEIEVIVASNFRDHFLAMVRSLFNQRAIEERLERLQFVIAGAMSPMQLVQDTRYSPFNVGVEIFLDDLSLEQTKTLASHLQDRFSDTEQVAHLVFAHTRGSVYLSQLLLERLWWVSSASEVGASEVEAIVKRVVHDARRDVYFLRSHERISGDQRLLAALANLHEGVKIAERERGKTCV